MRRLIAVSAVVAAALAAPGFAAESNVRDLVLKTHDLVFTVQDLYRVVKTAKETTIELPADVLFDFDKADIRPDAELALKEAARILREQAKGPVRVEGHTDAKGAAAYNQKLSERRAEAVMKWLVSHEKLAAAKFAIKGFGATKPAAPNANPDRSDNPEGRQRNRRVALVFAK